MRKQRAIVLARELPTREVTRCVLQAGEWCVGRRAPFRREMVQGLRDEIPDVFDAIRRTAVHLESYRETTRGKNRARGMF